MTRSALCGFVSLCEIIIFFNSPSLKNQHLLPSLGTRPKFVLHNTGSTELLWVTDPLQTLLGKREVQLSPIFLKPSPPTPRRPALDSNGLPSFFL
jgi:hypothetical protein